jgi:hypothetical protein
MVRNTVTIKGTTDSLVDPKGVFRRFDHVITECLEDGLRTSSNTGSSLVEMFLLSVVVLQNLKQMKYR